MPFNGFDSAIPTSVIPYLSSKTCPVIVFHCLNVFGNNASDPETIKRKCDICFFIDFWFFSGKSFQKEINFSYIVGTAINNVILLLDNLFQIFAGSTLGRNSHIAPLHKAQSIALTIPWT